MWNERLIACARAYPSAVLTVVEASGYPVSTRCSVAFDEAREVIMVPAPPPIMAGRQGKACLIFHRHDVDLGGQHELLIKGELREEESTLTLSPDGFLTGSGRQDTDRMPVAGTPLDVIRFMLLGRRKARAYLAKRGEPWPPRPWKKMLDYLDDPEAEYASTSAQRRPSS